MPDEIQTAIEPLPYGPSMHVQTHKLKTWAAYWDAVAAGLKGFEVRRDDRGFQRGDVLVLQRFNPETGQYDMDGFSRASSPKEIRRRVAYVLTGGQFGVEAGYVVMGLEEIRGE